MFDIIIIIIAIAGLLIGYQKGFMSQIGAVIGIVLGIIVCQVFADKLAAMYTSPTDTPNTRMLHQVLAYVVLFAACFLLGRFISTIGRNTTKALHLTFPDRLGGAAFKTLEYLLIFSIFLNVWIALFPDTKLRSSQNGLAEFTINFAPEVLGSETASDIFEATGDLKEGLEDLSSREVDAETMTGDKNEQTPR